MPLIFYHCFMMFFLAERNSLLIHSKEEHIFNRELYIGSIMYSRRSGLELSTIDQHRFIIFLKKDQKRSDTNLSFLDYSQISSQISSGVGRN